MNFTPSLIALFLLIYLPHVLATAPYPRPLVTSTHHHKDPKLQIKLHLANGGLYARDSVSSSEAYFVGRLPAFNYDRLVNHTLPLNEFISILDVKIGVAQNVSTRQREYTACEGNGHKRFFSVHTDQRYRLERLMHLDFECHSPRDRKQCSGKRCKKKNTGSSGHLPRSDPLRLSSRVCAPSWSPSENLTRRSYPLMTTTTPSPNPSTPAHPFIS
ncbi:hypothetical protein C8F04DRAFT_1198838 [Mycena alexandri]|uniref:Bacteriophage T5 Orf172 DNA-binding domain-containing protein n=1 Tax=Mycena alexandri TaxID=1745969 RepID=A0AAD6S042_9AGAR|nr:hypothetical protein C8F04DRAFT_1198838 [Mycena alexandri]